MDIIRAGDIMQEWNNLGSLEIGEVKSTDTGKGRLKSKCVFHVIGPSTECNFIAVRHNIFLLVLFSRNIRFYARIHRLIKQFKINTYISTRASDCLCNVILRLIVFHLVF